jgi:hypothetical protein
MRILLNLFCICIMFTAHSLLAQTEIPLKDGWERINLKGIGHFDIPASLLKLDMILQILQRFRWAKTRTTKMISRNMHV